MPSFRKVYAIPTGGAIGISYKTAVSGAVTLTRTASGAAPVTIMSLASPASDTGEAMFYLDIGEKTPGPLLNGQFFSYTLTDVDGSITSNWVQTVSTINLEIIEFSAIIITLLQGAVNAVTLNPGIQKARVLEAMPMSANPPLPMIVVNQDLSAQENIGIGADNPIPGDLIQPAIDNIWTQSSNDRHLFRITVVSNSPAERSFYRDFVIAVMRMSAAYAFAPFGADLSRSYESADYQSYDQTNLMIPGFYASDILFDFTAMNNVAVYTSYGLIETITVDMFSPQDDPTVDTQVQVPTL